MTFVLSRQVQELRRGETPAMVLDVRTPEEYAKAHLAGAVNACVFEVTFVDQVRRLIPERATPLVVYGEGPQSLESTEAVRQLAQAGYSQLMNFAGGLHEWRTDGLPTLGEHPASGAEHRNGPVPLDLSESRAEWFGRNLLNRHHGTVGFRSGTLVFEDDWLVGGEFVIDMNSIQCADIVDPAANQGLIRHLRSPDFFAVDTFPEAHLVIKKASPVPGGRPGVPNLQLLCAFTLRGVTRDLVVTAAAGRTLDGRLGAQAVLAFDRTDYGSAYGSSRFFQGLGRHLVNDLVEIHVRLLA
ncbi:MAG: YceI family protein [Verrucomicrobiales bacterium]|nr:YceI family protein [Verrucomicrobiales bacterium]